MKINGNTASNTVSGEPRSAQGFEIHFNSEGCAVEIGPDCNLDGLSLHLNRPAQRIVFAGGNTIRGQVYLTARDTQLHVGKGTKTNSHLWMNLAGNGTKVVLGENCLLASVRFRTSDSHKIFDIATGEVLNPPADIVVEDRVWIAEDVLLLRGARIGAGSIVGARAMVNGPLPAQCLAAGTPARVLREGVRWEE